MLKSNKSLHWRIFLFLIEIFHHSIWIWISLLLTFGHFGEIDSFVTSRWIAMRTEIHTKNRNQSVCARALLNASVVNSNSAYANRLRVRKSIPSRSRVTHISLFDCFRCHFALAMFVYAWGGKCCEEKLKFFVTRTMHNTSASAQWSDYNQCIRSGWKLGEIRYIHSLTSVTISRIVCDCEIQSKRNDWVMHVLHSNVLASRFDWVVEVFVTAIVWNATTIVSTYSFWHFSHQILVSAGIWPKGSAFRDISVHFSLSQHGSSDIFEWWASNWNRFGHHILVCGCGSQSKS